MPRRVDDDDEDDDRPRRRRRDDDEDDDDRPRRRPRGKSAGGSGPGTLIVAAVVGFFVLAAGGVGAYFALRSKPKPQPEVAAQPAPAAAQSGQPIGPQNTNPGGTDTPGGADSATATSRVVPVPTINPTITQLTFGGGGGGYTAIVANNLRGTGRFIDVVKTATGEAAGRLTLPSAADQGFAVSPDGKWVAALGLAPSQGNPVTLYAVADGRQVAKITPYPRTPATVTTPELLWATFVSTDRLLTVNAAGALDLWSVPEMTRAAGVPGSLPPTQPLGINNFTQSPRNFALTPDGKTLAVFDGTSFIFYDAPTLTETGGKTEPIPKAGSFTGAALSADGRRLASSYRTAGTVATTNLTVWDTKTGKRLSTATMKTGNAPAGFGWWGPRHLLFWQGGITTADIFDTESGRVVGSLRTTRPGKLATVPPDDKLWGVVGGSGFDPQMGAAFLVTVQPPVEMTAAGPNTQLTFELTPDGLRRK